MPVSKISRKGQVTIPKAVRKSMRARPGDWIEYVVQGREVKLRRVEAFDRAFHEALTDTLTEWTSPEDEEAFRDL